MGLEVTNMTCEEQNVVLQEKLNNARDYFSINTERIPDMDLYRITVAAFVPGHVILNAGTPAQAMYAVLAKHI